MRHINVDLRRGEYVVWSSSQTVSGIWYMNGVFARVPENASAADLAGAIEQALAASATGLPDRAPRDPDPFTPVLKAVKAPSYAKYAASAQVCAVEQDGDEVTVVAYRNNGPRQGMSALLDQAERLHAPAPEQIADAVRRVVRQAVAAP
jgi:hypothetical protein